jgi:hypothetical protein
MIVLRVGVCESARPPGSGIRPQCGKTFFKLNVTDPIFLLVASPDGREILRVRMEALKERNVRMALLKQASLWKMNL